MPASGRIRAKLPVCAHPGASVCVVYNGWDKGSGLRRGAELSKTLQQSPLPRWSNPLRGGLFCRCSATAKHHVSRRLP